ncbi:MAG: adenylate/guanylate cyclase domain-containing protein [Treponema sp.]|jgi:adenylate cyclase|nr:adenylate/guanylate cyclase domain-containing protein [Treponema sp.]
MKKEKREKRSVKAFSAFVIGGIVSAAVIALSFFDAFSFLEYKTYDLRVNLLGNLTVPSDDIIVILLNQDSLDWAHRERGWAWPWPRKAYAEIVDYMREGGARSIAFDVIFSEPSVYRNAEQDDIIDTAVASLEDMGTFQERSREIDRQTRARNGAIMRSIISALRSLGSREDDASFAQAEREFGRTVQTVVFSSQTGSADSWPADLEKPLFELENFDPILSRYTRLGQNSREGRMLAQFPIKELRNAAGAIGNVSGWPDSDGIFRRANLFTIFDGKAIPGLSAASLLASGNGSRISYDHEKKLIRWGDYTIPVDNNGRSILHFRGSLDRYIPYWAHQILQSADLRREALAAGSTEEPEGDYLPPENFAGKYVFFGYYAQGLFDTASTPISSLYPGVGMHITMLDNILQGDFIREVSPVFTVLIILAAVILITVLSLWSNRIPLVVGGLLLLIVLLAIFSFGAYQYQNLWVPMVAPMSGALLAFLTVTLYNYATEGSQKRFIKSAFSRYLAPSVIEQLIADPSKLNLGGEKREMTAIFTDIQRFSSISEALQKQYAEEGPKVLVELLNLYLTQMSDIVLENEGTIDKFEGDAIIAFFGAPIYTEKHASLACRAAIQMKKAEAAMKQKVMDGGGAFYLPLRQLVEKGVIRAERPLYTRIGVNTGDMVVGNMGTPNKMDYTIMGNAVNLAARLEGVNKQYNTGGILVSEYTRTKLGDEFVIRPLSRVRVVGVETPLRLYEILETRTEALEAVIEMAGLWERAFGLYEEGKFGEAAVLFAGIAQKDGKDQVAPFYLKRCETYGAGGPPPDFPVDNLTEK